MQRSEIEVSTAVYIKYIEYCKVHVSKRKIPRNRKVSGVFLWLKRQRNVTAFFEKVVDY